MNEDKEAGIRGPCGFGGKLPRRRHAFQEFNFSTWPIASFQLKTNQTHCKCLLSASACFAHRTSFPQRQGWLHCDTLCCTISDEKCIVCCGWSCGHFDLLRQH